LSDGFCVGGHSVPDVSRKSRTECAPHTFQTEGIQLKKWNADYADFNRFRRIIKTICEICVNLRNPC
jgi:hypothetical protein